MDNIEKIRGAQGDKAVLGILGDDWERVTSADIMKAMASNPGAGAGQPTWQESRSAWRRQSRSRL